MYEQDPTLNIRSKDENSSLEKLFLKITGCHDLNVKDVANS